MKKELLDYLICPDCLPRERRLALSAGEADGKAIFSGTLRCAACGRQYPVRDGVAVLLTEAHGEKNATVAHYETERVLSAYLWSHFGDLLGDPDSTDAYGRWGGRISGDPAGLALDVGCAVGRFTFQLGRVSRFAVGIDRSEAFIRLARRLADERQLSFSLIQEGNLSTERTIHLPPDWPSDHAEFIVADAAALPFPRSVVSTAASLNIIDKVPDPLAHLREVNRVTKTQDAEFLFSDPFSWSIECAPEARWLGGTTEGAYPGDGRGNVRRLLLGDDEILTPPWRIVAEGSVTWKIRNHRNHFEVIRSEYLHARR